MMEDILQRSIEERNHHTTYHVVHLGGGKYVILNRFSPHLKPGW